MIKKSIYVVCLVTFCAMMESSEYPRCCTPPKCTKNTNQSATSTSSGAVRRKRSGVVTGISAQQKKENSPPNVKYLEAKRVFNKQQEAERQLKIAQYQQAQQELAVLEGQCTTANNNKSQQVVIDGQMKKIAVLASQVLPPPFPVLPFAHQQVASQAPGEETN